MLTPRAEAKSTPYTVRLSPAERQIVHQAAQVNHQRPSQFVRDALVTAAAECLESPLVLRLKPAP